MSGDYVDSSVSDHWDVAETHLYAVMDAFRTEGFETVCWGFRYGSVAFFKASRDGVERQFQAGTTIEAVNYAVSWLQGWQEHRDWLRMGYEEKERSATIKALCSSCADQLGCGWRPQARCKSFRPKPGSDHCKGCPMDCGGCKEVPR